MYSKCTRNENRAAKNVEHSLCQGLDKMPLVFNRWQGYKTSLAEPKSFFMHLPKWFLYAFTKHGPVFLSS